MQANYLTNLRGTSLLAGILLALTGAQAAALPADAFPTFESYIKLSGQVPSITGNEAAFQKRIVQPKGGGLGIEDLHFTKDVNKETTMEIDGRALTGAEDYLAQMKLTKTEYGSLNAGYKSFRTFYDGIGGFFPLNKQWNAMTPEDLHIDRGEYWVKVELNQPNTPKFELSYVDGTRLGKKNSTIWGDSDFTGLPNNIPPISQVRKMLPSYQKIDEHHQALEGSVSHTLANTTFHVTVMQEKTDDNDTRYGMRFAGEVKPYPTPASTLLMPAGSMNNQVQYSQTDGMVTKMSGLIAKSETVFSDTVKVLAAFNYQDVDSTFSGDRPLYTTTPTAVGAVVLRANNNLGLTGGSQVKVYVGSLAFDWKPTPDWSSNLALRAEDKYTKSAGALTAVTPAVVATTGVVTTTNSLQTYYSRVKEKSLTPALDLNYTGIKDLALYASASVRSVSGDERYATPNDFVTTPVIANSKLAYNDMSENRLKYTIGGNWHQSSLLTLRGEIFHKDNTSKAIGYTLRTDGYADNYVLGFKFTGLKLTAIAKPTTALTSTTRYIYQKGDATVQGISVTGTALTGYAVTYPKYDSMDMVTHTIAETIDWTPMAQFYLQANASIVFNVIGTVYPRAGVFAATSTNIAFDANRVLQNSNNNFITASLVSSLVLTKIDDLQLQFSYYKADNYNPEVAAMTLPFGAGATEYSVTAGVKHKFSDRCIGNAKLGYYDAKNDTTGGNTNFKGPLAYVSLDYAL